MTLKELGIGKNAVILSVGGEGALRQHFLDMGPGRGSDHGKICADGGSAGTENPRV